MSTSNEEQEPGTEVIIPQEDALPTSTRTGHGKMPEHIDDDMYEKAAEQERVAAGLADYAADDVPPATDPPPPESSEEAGLLTSSSKEKGVRIGSRGQSYSPQADGFRFKLDSRPGDELAGRVLCNILLRNCPETVWAMSSAGHSRGRS